MVNEKTVHKSNVGNSVALSHVGVDNATGNKSEALCLLTTTQIFGRSVNFKRTRARDGHSKKEVEEGSFRPGDEADVHFRWQEKVFGPREIIAIATGKHQRKRGTANAGSYYSRLEVLE